MSLGVVFVNFHSERMIAPRAEALSRSGIHVVVVDNSGTYPCSQLETVRLPRNEGFGYACNRGAEQFGDAVDALCFHNPDVEATAASLFRLSQILAEQARPGAVAPVESTPAKLRPRGYAYPSIPREAGVAARAALRSASPLRTPVARAPRTPSANPDRRFPGGGLLVVAAEAHRAIGGFDEQYFLYAEDLDYWHRLGIGGWTREFASDVTVTHTSSTGSPGSSAGREILRWLGVELFAEKFGPNWRWLRRTHRFLLPLLHRREPDLASRVREQWSQRRIPSTTLEALRDYLSERGSEATRQ